MNRCTVIALACAASLAMACKDKGGATATPAGANAPPAKRLHRLTADQFHRSLQVVTGESWSQYGRFTATLGKPDYVQTPNEGRRIDVASEKLVEDASREVCQKAIDKDKGRAAEERVILRKVELSQRDHAAYAANLRYLTLRFHGVNIESDDDPSLKPWFTILESGTVADDNEMAERWRAVCIGMISHPDFLTY